ncbi:DNA replication licensing factor mcm8 [Entophlyctis luteolus]|nr:DNA replication licensing factor mcm8 [Entophlyctis luteolus]
MKRGLPPGEPATTGSCSAPPPKRPPAPLLFPHWSLYFGGEKLAASHPLVPAISAFSTFFSGIIGSVGPSRRTLAVSYRLLKANCGLSDLDERLVLDPESTLGCLGLAFANALIDAHGVDNVKRFRRQVRIVDYDEITPLKDLKANLMGRFITIRGTIVRVSAIKPVVTQISFTCNNCGDIQVIEQVDVDWQKIRIQEKLPDDQKDSGRIPRTVECELTEDLVDTVVPGDVVFLSGIVKVLETHEGKYKQKGAQMYYLYISGNSLVKASGSSESSEGDGSRGSQNSAESEENRFTKDGISFSRKDLYGIRQIHDVGDDELFKLLVNSLCPAIFGHEIVKAGLLLALFGGRRRESKDIEIRSNPHVLVVGDPGLGKSQMLSAVVKAAPRGVYVCGNTTTTSGLTVTLCKDGDTGDSGLEAGALVLGDRGVCCIDEFDKLTEHQALLEAMEQQSISIAKAGMVCTLPARTSVIAAANPVGGHYNKAKTVSENLKMNSALLSRFDLVFILLDKPNEQMDKFLSDHIMKLHSGNNKGKERAITSWGDWCPSALLYLMIPQTGKSSSSEHMASQDIFSQDLALSERLKITADDFDPVPLSLLRKYIAYSKQYVHPKISRDAALVLQEFYLTLRTKYRSIDSTPITTRQLESMMRLVEARARAELRTEATKEDALDVVAIMKFSLWDTYDDGIGGLCLPRSQLGVGSSKQNESKRFMAQLNRIVTETSFDKFNWDQLLEIAKEIGINVANFKEFVENLNHQGYLLKKGNRLYSIAL